MTAAKNIIAVAVKTTALLLLIGLQSCGSTYNTKTAEIESDLLSGNFDMALARLDQNTFLQKDRNRLLYLMEKGKLEHLKGNYEISNQVLEEAYIMIDDRIRTNAGQAIAAKFTSPMAEPYKGEDFEKVTVHYYKALNYFHLGMPNEALVEAKRINIKLQELNQKYNDNKNKYSEDAFSHILEGVLYECTGDINGAFIAYRNAEEIYNTNSGAYFGVLMPEQLKQDLLRTTKSLGFTQEHMDYRKKFNVPPDPVAPKKPEQKKGAKKGKNQKDQPKEQPKPEEPKAPVITGEAVIFWENGLGPAKDQIVITASGGSGVFYGSWMDEGVLEEILIPIPVGAGIGSINAIAIPKYRKRDNYYTKASLEFNNTDHQFELAQDFYPIAKQCLKDRMLRETIDLVLRFATKKASSSILGEIVGQVAGDTAGDLTKLAGDAAGAATEKADTRNWQSLPQTISYLRVPLKDGVDNKFVMKKYGAYGIDTDTLVIPYKRGLQIVNYFDLSRTQIITKGSSTPGLAATPTANSAATLGGMMLQVQGPATQAALPPMDKAIEAKYNKWFDAGNGISYMVTCQTNNYGGKDFYAKKVYLKSDNPKKVKVTYTITERPLSDRYTEVSAGEFYKNQSMEGEEKQYFSLSEKIKPGKEVPGYAIYHFTPDFYVTIINVE